MNEFKLFNITGGCGGTFRLRDGKLSRRAVRVLEDSPFGGWVFRGPAASAASVQWESLETQAHEAGARPSKCTTY